MKRRLASDAAEVRAAIMAVLPSLVGQWLPKGEQRGDIYVALNPRRNDRSLGSFQINTRTGKWKEYATEDKASDAISLYVYLNPGIDSRAAFRAVANDPLVKAAIGGVAMPPPAKLAVPLKSQAAEIARARRIYTKATVLENTAAKAYLLSRGLHPTAAWDRLRASVQYYPAVGACPALIAPIDDSNGALVGLHRTYLTPAGTKLPVANPRRSLGQVSGGAIRLGEPIDDLIICEGLEDGLTLFQKFDGMVPVWVAGGASFLHLMPIPVYVRRLTIAADNDAAGRRAAWRAADAFGVGGRVVRIWPPRSGFKDFNDQIRGIKSKASKND